MTEGFAAGPLLIIGGSGQVGSSLTSLLKAGDARVLSSRDLDFSKISRGAVAELLEACHPSAVINAAGYNQVNQAEAEEALARRINCEAPALIAEECFKLGIPFVQYSTDYVFDGRGSTPWTEENPPHPLNAYGRTKLAAESAIQAAARTSIMPARYLIFRTSWVYAAQGKNFLNTMLSLGADRERVQVVCDQIGAPTYAPYVAQATLRGLRSAVAAPVFPSGIYHLCNAGETSWRDFTVAIFEGARARGQRLRVKSVDPVSTAEYPTPACRPLNSRLSCEKARQILGVELPDWRIGLNECLDAKFETTRREGQPI